MMLGKHISNCSRKILLTHFAAFAGKFPFDGGYIDARHSRPPADNSLDANLGRFPLIQTSHGISIGQSSAINFYIASMCGLLGKNATETACVLSFSSHIQVRKDLVRLSGFELARCIMLIANLALILQTQELQESWARLVPFGNVPTERNFKTFFEGSDARDFSGPADSQTISQRFVQIV